jgi:hypothetical protein
VSAALPGVVFEPLYVFGFFFLPIIGMVGSLKTLIWHVVQWLFAYESELMQPGHNPCAPAPRFPWYPVSRHPHGKDTVTMLQFSISLEPSRGQWRLETQQAVVWKAGSQAAPAALRRQNRPNALNIAVSGCLSRFARPPEAQLALIFLAMISAMPFTIFCASCAFSACLPDSFNRVLNFRAVLPFR